MPMHAWPFHFMCVCAYCNYCCYYKLFPYMFIQFITHGCSRVKNQSGACMIVQSTVNTCMQCVYSMHLCMSTYYYAACNVSFPCPTMRSVVNHAVAFLCNIPKLIIAKPIYMRQVIKSTMNIIIYDDLFLCV